MSDGKNLPPAKRAKVDDDNDDNDKRKNEELEESSSFWEKWNAQDLSSTVKAMNRGIFFYQRPKQIPCRKTPFSVQIIEGDYDIYFVEGKCHGGGTPPFSRTAKGTLSLSLRPIEEATCFPDEETETTDMLLLCGRVSNLCLGEDVDQYGSISPMAMGITFEHQTTTKSINEDDSVRNYRVICPYNDGDAGEDDPGDPNSGPRHGSIHIVEASSTLPDPVLVWFPAEEELSGHDYQFYELVNERVVAPRADLRDIDESSSWLHRRLHLPLPVCKNIHSFLSQRPIAGLPIHDGDLWLQTWFEGVNDGYGQYQSILARPRQKNQR